MRLFLFDVDGTLVWAHGAGRIALSKAVVAVYGTPPVYENYDTRGKTDPRIVYDVMHAAGVADEVIYSRLPSCFESYLRHLNALIDDGHPVQAASRLAARLARTVLETRDEPLTLRGRQNLGVVLDEIHGVPRSAFPAHFRASGAKVPIPIG